MGGDGLDVDGTNNENVAGPPATLAGPPEAFSSFVRPFLMSVS
jgi:hypothetical protein